MKSESIRDFAKQYPQFWFGRMATRTAEQKLLGHLQQHDGHPDPQCAACKELKKAAESENPNHD